MGKLIDQQAAIDAINNIMPTKEGFYEPSEVLWELMKLPSAQPELYEDAISRQDAINALDDEITITGKSNAYVVKDYVQRVKRKLENLPFVTPKRKTGKWIHSDFSHEFLHCSQCGRGRHFCSNFCPNCGADMRQREENK